MGMAKAERKSSRRPWSYHGLQYAERGCRSDRQLQNTPVADALGIVRIINRFPRRRDQIPISLRTSIRNRNRPHHLCMLECSVVTNCWNRVRARSRLAFAPVLSSFVERLVSQGRCYRKCNSRLAQPCRMVGVARQASRN